LLTGPGSLSSDHLISSKGVYDPAEVKSLKWLGLAVGLILLVIGTVMVFVAFDRDSHSASDTIRPFLITMVPVWAVAIAAAIVLLRRPSTP
jgi:hypothetical protein